MKRYSVGDWIMIIGFVVYLAVYVCSLSSCNNGQSSAGDDNELVMQDSIFRQLKPHTP